MGYGLITKNNRDFSAKMQKMIWICHLKVDCGLIARKREGGVEL